MEPNDPVPRRWPSLYRPQTLTSIMLIFFFFCFLELIWDFYWILDESIIWMNADANED